MAAIGYATRQDDGSFKGQFTALERRADIEITKSQEEHREPDRLPRRRLWRRDRRGVPATSREVWRFSLSLAAPSARLYEISGRAAGQDDDNVCAVIRNPADFSRGSDCALR